MFNKCRVLSRFYSIGLACFLVISVFFLTSFDVEAYSGSFFITSDDLITASFSCKDLILDLPEEFNTFESGKVYEVSYTSSFDFLISDYCVLNNFAVSLNLEYFSALDYSFSLFHFTGEKVLSDGTFSSAGSGKFCIVARDSYPADYFSVDISGYLSEFDYENDDYLNSYTFEFDVTSVTLLSEDDSAAYENGYAAGFSDGEDSGYDSGYSSGYNSGYTAGKDSVDTDSYYDSGYNDGYAAGKDSVDTDAYYQEGYDAGYKVAYQEGYDAAYEEAYALGYAAAVEALSSNSVVSGASASVSKSLSISNTSLDIEDVNTRLPVVYDYWKDYEIYYTGSLSDGRDGFVEFLDTDGDGVNDYADLELYSDDVEFSSFESINDGMVGLGYYLDGVQKLFTASTDAYAYKITVKQSSTSFTRSDVWKAWNIVGTQSDVLSGDADMGSRFYQGSTLEHTFFIYTDNLPIDIYSGVLFYFFDTDETAASYTLSSALKIEYTPYTRTEYNQIIKSIDNLTNGYDNPDSDSITTDLSGSVDDYLDLEGSLFDSASSGLKDFTFFDFDSVPAMLTGISFCVSIMDSWFIASGGFDGVGIILSILFSVMILSFLLGLFRLYQSRGRRKGD